MQKEFAEFDTETPGLLCVRACVRACAYACVCMCRRDIAGGQPVAFDRQTNPLGCVPMAG